MGVPHGTIHGPMADDPRANLRRNLGNRCLFLAGTILDMDPPRSDWEPSCRVHGRNGGNMKTTRNIFRTAAIAPLAVLLIATPSKARATEIIPSIGLTRSVDTEETKSTVGLAIRGSAIPSVLAIELKGQYRKQDRFNGQLTEKMWPITASAWLTPLRVIYAGGGVGWYHTTLDYNAPSPLQDETTQKFGVHLGGGVRVPIAPAVALDMNGRYVWLEKQETAIVPKEFNPDFWDMSLGLGLHF
ncbi:MAG: porin family protein [Candidatus Eisenbacteria bacterium]|uniref:Porin family protein n=1 Tax=Eiseniibacteriota bacterium TaxID=2212470 RepID=A0A538SXX7_UNCEI|nr:MAG: porin family protein [Candidatus Eisenbacteria bacterium]